MAAQWRQVQATGARLVLVSLCSTPADAAAWSRAVRPSDDSVPLWHVLGGATEPPAALHAAMGFARSLAGSWGPAALQTYAQRSLRAEPPERTRGQDIHRMGGDVVVDARGVVRLLHPSRSSTDRPSVATLLQALRALPPAPAPLDGDDVRAKPSPGPCTSDD